MNVLTVAAPSSLQTHFAPDRDHTLEEFTTEEFVPDIPLHQAFASRSAQVDRLIDEKIGYIMESARLRSLVKSNPEGAGECLALIQNLEAEISRLQEQIDRELKGLFYSLQKAPAPTSFLDDLPG